jgi:hypothetical protein
VKVWECPYETEVLQAVQSGQWERLIHSHVSVCAICQEVVQVAEWMQVLAATPENEPALPSPARICWKGQWLEKQAAGEQATRPIAIFQHVACVVAVLSLVMVAFLRALSSAALGFSSMHDTYSKEDRGQNGAGPLPCTILVLLACLYTGCTSRYQGSDGEINLGWSSAQACRRKRDFDRGAARTEDRRPLPHTSY